MTIEPNNLYLGDCYELIKEIPDKSIDLVIIDPPYEMVSGGGGTSELALRVQKNFNVLKHKKLDNGIDLAILKELERVLKHLYLYIWCNKNLLFKLINHYYQRTDINLDLITWGKLNPMPTCNNHFLNDCEYCLCIREKNIGLIETANYEVKKKCYMTPINQSDKELYNHPTIKPIEIIKNFILNSSRENDLVLDCFMGSGTTCIAAKELGRRYIGIEVSEEYFNIAKDRLKGITQKERKNNYEQLDLFEQENL